MLKLLHTSDWHLGAKLGRHDRAPDHQAALRGLLDLAESIRPDLILHTGEFDAFRPPHDALRLGVQALRRLAAVAPTGDRRQSRFVAAAARARRPTGTGDGRGRRRMVVLISHVQAVAEQVADVAAVTRTHAGSRIEWLSGAERRHLGESEAGSAALGWLLEQAAGHGAPYTGS